MTIRNKTIPELPKALEENKNTISNSNSYFIMKSSDYKLFLQDKINDIKNEGCIVQQGIEGFYEVLNSKSGKLVKGKTAELNNLYNKILELEMSQEDNITNITSPPRSTWIPLQNTPNNNDMKLENMEEGYGFRQLGSKNIHYGNLLK